MTHVVVVVAVGWSLLSVVTLGGLGLLLTGAGCGPAPSAVRTAVGRSRRTARRPPCVSPLRG